MVGIGMTERVFGKNPFSVPLQLARACRRDLRRTVTSRVNVAVALLIAAGNAQATEPIVGDALVIDGDTIEIAGEQIQFHGVDAPEDWQVCLDETGADYACGEEAARALDEFLAASRPTRCEFVRRDRYGRFIGACFRKDGEDVNRWLVSTGNAVERENHGQGVYASAQESARSAGVGIWRGQPKREHTQQVAEE